MLQEFVNNKTEKQKNMKHTIFILLLFISLKNFSQVTSSIHFIGCTPALDGWQVDSLKLHIYDTKSDSLILRKSLPSSNSQECVVLVDYLSRYRRLNLLIKSNIKDSLYYARINFDNPDNVNLVKLGFINFDNSRWYSIDKQNIPNLIVKGIDLNSKDISLWDINSFNGNANKTSENIFKNDFYSEGCRGLFADWITLYLINNNNKYFIHPVIWGHEQIEIEPFIKDKYKKSNLVISVNTENYLIYHITDSTYYDPKSKLGALKILIYDKRIKEWSNYHFKGDLSSYALFDNWLVGEVINYYSNKSMIKTPGGKYRSRTMRGTGMPMDFLFEEKKIYCPGILFLFNLKTRKYIEWQTYQNGEPQGDSEIILVGDDIVYYRMNDEIYKAPILNGEKLGKAQLLIKDPRVPDIHWAFITGK
jgi:hypothetical protein